MAIPVFKILNLICEYGKDSPVLSIQKLDIPRSKLVFVIGKSGIGKSTFIETLGLMNNTIGTQDNTKIEFYPKNELKSCIELKGSWLNENEELASFRKSHFSFVFQNTNLMPNFSAGENMMMSLLIRGVDLNLAKNKVLEVMEKLALPSDIFNKSITELSGGQRQRLAFVRAVTSNYTVIFGDEPTGNLDKKTASKLMSLLKKLVSEEQKTGIIVSHDLELAANFADVIIPITESENISDNKIGLVLNENILERTSKGWFQNGNMLSKEIREYLIKYLIQNTI